MIFLPGIKVFKNLKTKVQKPPDFLRKGDKSSILPFLRESKYVTPSYDEYNDHQTNISHFDAIGLWIGLFESWPEL